jgi:hypothetical protein
MCFDIIADVEIKGNPRKCLKRALGNRALWLKIVEIEDQQYPCSNRDQKVWG